MPEKQPTYIQLPLDLLYPEHTDHDKPTEQPVRNMRRLHDGLSSYLDLDCLRRLAADGQNLHGALRRSIPPAEVVALLETLSAVLKPTERVQIKSPHDIAALLMVEMAYLDQEELRTVLLDTKNRLQGIVTVYKGSLNTSMIRVGEVYKEALRRNSAAIIVAHNHPSGEVQPSPEDVRVTREIVAAGQLLDVECLDHLVIGQGKWLSLRERGLGFTE